MTTQQVPIAIVGVSALFPGSSDAAGFWRDILAGRDLISDVPASHWRIEDYYDPDPRVPDKTYAKRGGFLSPVDFDPLEFGVPPGIVPATDTSQLLALIVAQKVLDDACQGQFASLDRERVSVILGVTSAQELLASLVSRLQHPVWTRTLREAGLPEQAVQGICERLAASYVPWQEASFPGLLGNVVAGRIANRFDLRGTNAITDAACASTLSAVSMSLNELALGQSDLVITGGVDAMNDVFMYVCFSKTPALSRAGECRPFSEAADGTLLGEGLAMVALKRLSDAERDGDRVYAVIRGLGAASDGRTKSVYAPLPEGQARALQRAYAVAGYGPETVELVEAHGTGTKAGDVAEVEGLRMVFDPTRPERRQWCALGSVKSQIGHTKAAAGAAGLFKAVMALHHKVLPPTIKVERPNPKLGLDASAFYLNTAARPWIRDGARHPRRASVSSFGFGGSNFHVTLEEYLGPNPAWRLRTTPTELVMVTAESEAALAQRCRELAGALARDRAAGAHKGGAPEAVPPVEQGSGGELAALARRSQTTFDAAAHARLALVASSTDDLARMLGEALRLLEAGAPVAAPGLSLGVGRREGRLAFLFPGQGSQYVGMGADVAMADERARAVWDATAALTLDGRALHEVVFPRPAFTDTEREAQRRELTATEWAQPALGVTSLALLRVLEGLGVRPDCVAGHSFGEVTALAAAGVLDAAGDRAAIAQEAGATEWPCAGAPAALARVARRRGELMRDAAEVPGAMLAVPLPLDEVRDYLAQAPTDVVIANHNHPAQAVLSGPADAIAALAARLAAERVSASRLPVATAFHSPLVAAASGRFRAFLDGVALGAPAVEVYANSTAAPYPADPRAVRDLLAEQIARPVRFVELIEAMWAAGVRTFVEVGPGSVLSDLVARILGQRPHLAVPLDRKGKHGVTALQDALGRLAAAGVPVDFRSLWTPFRPPASDPARKPALVIPISGTNCGKPYPPAADAIAPPPLLPAPAAPAPVAAAPVPVPAPVVLPAPVAAAPAAAAAPQLGWIQAYQEAQRQTSDAHAAYQRAMAESHAAFLRTVESSFAGLTALMTGAAVLPAGIPVPAPMLEPAAERPAPAPVPPAPVPSVPAPPVFAPPAFAPLAPAPLAPAPPAPAPPAPAPPAPVAAVSGTDLAAVLLQVVAEKTGYPAEILQLEMDLEADLGVDSIKRVEILAALRERAGSLPEIGTGELAQLRTLRQIVSALDGRGAAAPPEPPAAPAAAPADAGTGPDLEAVMLAVVAEKTGYPADVLRMDMELEADLGIDSIKRVEILAALQERRPALPALDAGDLARLRTLGQIAEFLRGSAAPAPPAAPVAPPAVVEEPSKPDVDVERFVVTAVPAEPVGLAAAGLHGARRAVVTDDGHGVAEEVVRQLARSGIQAEIVGRVPADADAVVFLGGLREAHNVDAAIAVNREAFAAAQAVAPLLSEHGGLFVTVQDTGGDFGLSGRDALRPWLSGVAALARTAAAEWPGAAVRALDVERGGRPPAAVAEAIVGELLRGGTVREVGLHADGRRLTLRASRRAVQAAAIPLDRESVVVVSGGGRGITAAAAVELARRVPCRFVLLGRTVLEPEPPGLAELVEDAALKREILARAQHAGGRIEPAAIAAQVARIRANREIRRTLAAIEAVGAAARYLACDVTDPDVVAATLTLLRREWGPITGLVHGAGVLADKRIAEKTLAQFDRVFDAKVKGLRALLGALDQDPLRFLALFSSAAARSGNPGQANYAMANEILNKVAAAERRRRGVVVKSIGWGPWEAGMVSRELKAHFKRRGVDLVPVAGGARMFVDELGGSPDEVETVISAGVAGAALGPAPTPAANLELRVHASTHPWLGDHRVGEKVVVPVAMAAEWIARAARACRPDLRVVGLRDLKVLRGIGLGGYETAGDRLAVRARQLSNGDDALIAAEIRSPGRPGEAEGALHYSAAVEMAHAPLAAPVAPPAPVLPAWTHDPIYDGHTLFHGAAFRVIRAVDGIGPEGLAAVLAGAGDLGWTGDFSLDPAMLDGGLQLAVLWARGVLGGASLPMAIGQLRIHATGLCLGPIHGFVQAVAARNGRAVCDVTLAATDGRRLTELRAVELILRPARDREAAAPAGAPELVPAAGQLAAPWTPPLVGTGE